MRPPHHEGGIKRGACFNLSSTRFSGLCRNFPALRKLARGLLEIPGVAEIRIWEADCMHYVRSGLCVLGLLLSYAASACAESLTKVGVVLNFAADGGAAGFYHALERGYFRELGLDVTIEPSKGSADAITRTASQASDIGIGDISTLVELASRRPEIAPKAVFILHNRSPQAVIALKSSGIAKLGDLHGHILGQGPADAPSRMFPAVASIAGLDMSRIEVRQFSPQLRDTMLLTKQVDAVTGFDSTVLFNLKANGVAVEDATVIYYADNGLDVYGNAFLANPP